MKKHYTDQKISDWIIEQNNQFILFNKPAGMPSQKDQTPETDLHTLASIYTKSDVYLVNRVDRPASGLVLMAKSPDAATKLSRELHSLSGTKKYLAIVEQSDNLSEASEITSYVKKGRNNKAVLSEEPREDFKKAVMRYTLLQKFDNYDLLSVEIDTGRFHQIRVQLASLGLHIKGDVKYGARRKNKDRSIALHAWKMQIKHPVSGEKNIYSAPLPKNDILWSFMEG